MNLLKLFMKKKETKKTYEPIDDKQEAEERA
jgi:hypothetical protein